MESELLFHDMIKDSHSQDKRTKYNQIIMREFDVKEFVADELNDVKCPNDITIKLTDDTIKKIEVKSYNHHQNSNLICLEQYNNINEDYGRLTRGWTHNLTRSHTNYILFVWHGKHKECYLIVKAELLGYWWWQHSDKYKIRKNKPTVNEKTGERWQSAYSYVPIKDLPDTIIYRHKQFVDLYDFWSQKGGFP